MSSYFDTNRYMHNLQKHLYSNEATEGRFEFPIMEPVHDTSILTLHWLPFNYAYCIPNEKKKHIGIHFFIDDYQFERVWKEPERYTEMLRPYGAVCAPDFSIYHIFPEAVRIYNAYRSNWVGRYWQQHGLTVIPTIRWAFHDAWEWCFDGVPHNSIVARSSVGWMDDNNSINQFKAGYDEMVRRISPSHILWKGKVPEGIDVSNLTFIEPFSPKQGRKILNRIGG